MDQFLTTFKSVHDDGIASAFSSLSAYFWSFFEYFFYGRIEIKTMQQRRQTDNNGT